MINKQGLLFLTLTSLILVLSVYYITMPNELLLTTNSNHNNTSDTVSNNIDNSREVNVNIKEASTILAMQNILNDERIKMTKELNDKLVNTELTIEEKNNIYEELKMISKIEGLEESIKKKIKEEFDLDSFVKISDDVVEVVINSSKHDTSLVVKIINSVSSLFDSKMYVSVSFKE